MDMRGSGIDSRDYYDNLTCNSGRELEDGSLCEFDGEVYVWVNDWGLHGWECPQCGEEHEFESEEDDEYDPERELDRDWD